MTYTVTSIGVFHASDDEMMASAAKSAQAEFMKALETLGIRPVEGTVSFLEVHHTAGDRVLLEKDIHKAAT